jgi:hypothetical protein
MKANEATKASAGRTGAGYALLMVMLMTAVSVVILAGTLSRTYSEARINDRNNQYIANQNAAEAAVEKAFARMAYDFWTPGLGLGCVVSNVESGFYQTNLPNENEYWNNFVFSDAQGHDGRIYVGRNGSYSGPLPSQFNNGGTNLNTLKAPIYRIVANVRQANGRIIMTNAVQEDVLLALVPIDNNTIFYQGLMEFTWCAPFTIRGNVHGNGSIYTGSACNLTFNGPVTACGTISSPAWDGHSTKDYSGKVAYTPSPVTNTPTVTLSLNMTNTHSLIDEPPSGEDPNSPQGRQRMYNQASVVLLVSNTAVTVKIQAPTPESSDLDPTVLTYTNTVGVLLTNLPFLSLTNAFTDQRENKTVQATQVDIGKYAQWIATNVYVVGGKIGSTTVNGKFPTGSQTYPTILFVADDRTTTSSQLSAVRITNGIAPPVNGGLGFSLATPDPLYVWGNYNQTNASFLNTSNTSAGTVPSALMSDALTILSPSWKDSQSGLSLGSNSKNDASDTTINAAILTGIVYSTGSGASQFSGGVMNLPRLLEDWGNGGSTTLTMNTSTISLFASTRATTQFQNPGVYYYAPSRNFNYDLNFLDPGKQPPGMPCALMPVRFAWATPPPNTINYNVTP